VRHELAGRPHQLSQRVRALDLRHGEPSAYLFFASASSSRSCFCCSRSLPRSEARFMVRPPSRIVPEGSDSTFFTGCVSGVTPDWGFGGLALSQAARAAIQIIATSKQCFMIPPSPNLYFIVGMTNSAPLRI